MKYYIKLLSTIIFLLTLFAVQWYLFAHTTHSPCNTLLIAYLYVLFTQCSIITLATLALMLDSLTYLSTGIFGLTLLFLVPSSWLALHWKNNMYNKIALPCFFIFCFAIFYETTLIYYLHYSYTTLSIFKNISSFTIINTFGLILIWKLMKRPFHD